MKVEVRKIIGKKIRSLDQVVPPEVKWTKEASWAKLDQKLRPSHSKSRNGKTYSHYYAAASVAFLVVFSWVIDQQSNRELSAFGRYVKPDTREIHASSKTPVSLSSMWVLPSETKPLKLDLVTPSGVNNGEAEPQWEALIEAKKGQMVMSPLPRFNTMAAITNPDKKKPKFLFEVPIGVSWLDKKVGPTLALRAGLFMPNGSNSFTSLAISAHTHLLLDNQEGGGLRLAPQTFLNLEFGKTWHNSRQKRRSWQVGMGYLVAGQADILPAKTVKIFSSVGFGRFRIGPEIILTDDLKSIVPGITITHS